MASDTSSCRRPTTPASRRSIGGGPAPVHPLERLFTWLRQWLLARFVRRAIVSLPEGVFRPFGGTTARAAIVVLEKLPARVSDFAIGIVDNPGYDTTRKRFKATKEDDLAAMRIAFKAGQLSALPTNTRSWVPEELLSQSTIPEAVPVLTLGEIAPWRSGSRSSLRGQVYAEIDLGDIDKLTGKCPQVARARWPS